MSTASLPAMSEIIPEPVDPPEVVREKAGLERTTAMLLEYLSKMREFNGRVNHLSQEVGRLAGAWFGGEVIRREAIQEDRKRLVARTRPIVIAAEQLARYASGLIENARIPQIDKIELQLRNAELEAELIEARHLIG